MAPDSLTPPPSVLQPCSPEPWHYLDVSGDQLWISGNVSPPGPVLVVQAEQDRHDPETGEDRTEDATVHVRLDDVAELVDAIHAAAAHTGGSSSFFLPTVTYTSPPWRFQCAGITVSPHSGRRVAIGWATLGSGAPFLQTMPEEEWARGWTRVPADTAPEGGVSR
ncbi:hypothetical protein [Streptomyces sp. CAU 1734]|uniref:hypothetical protein n=1 Tax=Streptomyces sp. CAU 1734 TaxID=3140360 RepID=UPI003260E8DF